MRLLTLSTILVATDLDEGSRRALTTARELAESAGAAVHVVHVSDHEGALETMAATLGDLGLSPEDASLHVLRGDPAHAINLLGEKIGADAILIGPHRARRDVDGRDALGSTALALVTNASVPCMVVTRALRLPLRRTVAAVDVSDTARGTLAVGLSWSSALRVQGGSDTDQSTVLTVLHVRQSTGPDERLPKWGGKLEEMLTELRQDAGSWAGAAIESAMIENVDAASGIADYANSHRPDMVVVGTRGLGLDSVGRIGSVAAALLQKVDVPVLLVPPAVWMQPASQST